MHQLYEEPRLVVEHFLSDVTERTDDFTTEAEGFAFKSNGNFDSKVAVLSENGDAEWYILCEIAVKLHIAVEADTTDDAMAGMGVLPERIAELAYFLVF